MIVCFLSPIPCVGFPVVNCEITEDWFNSTLWIIVNYPHKKDFGLTWQKIKHNTVDNAVSKILSACSPVWYNNFIVHHSNYYIIARAHRRLQRLQIWRPSYLHNRISYSGMMAFSYQIGPQVPVSGIYNLKCHGIALFEIHFSLDTCAFCAQASIFNVSYCNLGWWVEYHSDVTRAPVCFRSRAVTIFAAVCSCG